MARIWSMMDIGKRSMMNSQTALQTVAHNVANKSTEGYSRQRVDFKTNDPVSDGRLRLGTGATPGTVTRINNQYLEKQIQRETNTLGYNNGRADLLGRVEQVYNEQETDGLSKQVTNFFNSLRELSNNPESLATRTMVKENGQAMANAFHHVSGQLRKIQKDADFRIKEKITEINQLTTEISSLNEKIAQVEVQGSPANDERDRRDLLLKKLGQKINIRYAEGKSGELTITAGNTAVLVSGNSHRDLTVEETPGRDGKRQGNVDIFYKSTDNSTPVNVTKQMTGGEIGGLLNVRDKTVNQNLHQLDNMAYHLATEINRAHVQGYDRYNQKGQVLFEVPLDGTDAAETIALNGNIARDVGLIAAAGQPDAPGDNRIANIMSSVEYKPVMEKGSTTIGDYYSTMVGEVGVEAQRANSAQASQKDIVSQLKNIRESLSGVSLDEETTKMIEFQKGFQASARLIRTADEMMDTVLNLKRY